MGQPMTTGRDHPVFACVDDLYRHDKLQRIRQLCAQELLKEEEFTEVMAWVLPKCQLPAHKLHVPAKRRHSSYRVSVELLYYDEAAAAATAAADTTPLTLEPSEPSSEPTASNTTTTLYPESLLCQHRDTLKSLFAQYEELLALRGDRSPTRMQLGRELFQNLACVYRTMGARDKADEIEHDLSQLGNDEYAETSADATDTRSQLELDMWFLQDQFMTQLGRVVRETLEHGETVEQYEARKELWPNVHELMMLACAAGVQRTPPVPQATCAYYMRSAP